MGKILDGKSSGQIARVGLKGKTGCFTETCERMFSRIAVAKGFLEQVLSSICIRSENNLLSNHNYIYTEKSVI